MYKGEERIRIIERLKKTLTESNNVEEINRLLNEVRANAGKKGEDYNSIKEEMMESLDLELWRGYNVVLFKLGMRGNIAEWDNYKKILFYGTPWDQRLFFVVRDVINDWDPIGIAFQIDEYDPEVGDIAHFLITTPETDVESLAENIYEVFIKWFDDIFGPPKSLCLPIAQKLMDAVAAAREAGETSDIMSEKIEWKTAEELKQLYSIKAIIDEWDPEDEDISDLYDTELNDILSLLKTTTEADEVAVGLYRIFGDEYGYGGRSFDEVKPDYIANAQKLLAIMTTSIPNHTIK